MKKKIVLLIPSLKRGGAERVVSRLTTILKGKYNISVVIFDSSQIDYACDAPIIDLNEKATSGNLFIKFTKVIKRAYKYNKYKKKNKVDITYSFGNTANLINVYSFGKDEKITSIRGFGNLSLGKNSVLNTFYQRLLKMIFIKSDSIVSVSKVIKDNIIDNFNISEKKINVIYNGYNVKGIQDKCVVQKKEPKSFKFVSMGTYRKEKNYPRLLDAFAEVEKKYKNIKLIIIGEGNDIQMSKIEEIIKENQLQDKVELVGFKSNPYELISSCDCYILSSLSEGFPNALVEAMACGLPVVATDCETGPKEILSDKKEIGKKTKNIEYAKYGILVTPEYGKKEGQDPLSRAMIKIIEDTNLRETYAGLSVERASFFSYSQWKKDHFQLLG